MDPFIHEKALVETNAIGEGTRIWAFAHVLKDVRIGSDCNIGDHAFIESGVTIGDNVTIKNGVCVWQHVHIADNAFLGPNAVLTNDLTPRSRDTDWVPVETWIEEGVSVGANATIVCGVTLGEYSFIGAGSVVTRDVPAYALIAGVPGKRIGWMCQCGERLPDSGTGTCKQCGSRYESRGATIERVSAP